MNKEMKEVAELMASHFLETMPKEIWDTYKERKLHEKLAFFWCWCEEVKDET